MSNSLDIFIKQGADFSQEYELTNRSGDLLDVSGYTGKSQLRKSPTSNIAYDFVVTLARGSLILSMPASTTTLISPGKYQYDTLLMSSGNTTVTRVIEGIATLTPKITE